MATSLKNLKTPVEDLLHVFHCFYGGGGGGVIFK